MPHVPYRMASLLAALALFSVGQAHAFGNPFSDKKIIGALACQPLHPTTDSEVQFMSTENGLVNFANYTVRIACPIVKDALTWGKDEDGDTTLESGARLHYWFKAGSVPGRVTCTIYAGKLPYGVVATTASAPSMPANTSGYAEMYLTDPPNSAGVPHPVNLVCTMEPKTAFQGYMLSEYEITEL